MREIGLVNHVVPGNRLIIEAKKVADKIAEKGLIVVSSALKMVMQDSINDFDKESKVEDRIFEKIYETGDWRERISAFLQKRQT